MDHQYRHYPWGSRFVLCLVGLLVLASSVQAEHTLVTFSVMGDTPYSERDARTLQHQLATLNPDSEFVVHLGDIKTGRMSCSALWYNRVAAILKQSPKRLFIVPGDNEWNDCADPDQAWILWTRSFLHFDEAWTNTLTVVRDPRHPENFAFISRGVLFVGINLVGGKILNVQDWVLRDHDNIQWIESQVQYAAQLISRLVIFGHALPGPNHQIFFALLNRVGQDFGKPILYLHGDGHEWIKDYPFAAKNILRVQVEQGGKADPITVRVTDNPKEPFVFVRE